MNKHFDYEKFENSSEDNYRNVKKRKIRGKYCEINIEVSQDRDSIFEPKIVTKRKKDISLIEDKLIIYYKCNRKFK